MGNVLQSFSCPLHTHKSVKWNFMSAERLLECNQVKIQYNRHRLAVVRPGLVMVPPWVIGISLSTLSASVVKSVGSPLHAFGGRIEKKKTKLNDI